MEKSEPLMIADGFYEKNVRSVSFFYARRSRSDPGGVFPMTFHSILFERTEDSRTNEPLEAPAFFVDLNLDQMIDAITAGRQGYTLKPFFMLLCTISTQSRIVMKSCAILKIPFCLIIYNHLRKTCRQCANISHKQANFTTNIRRNDGFWTRWKYIAMPFSVWSNI